MIYLARPTVLPVSKIVFFVLLDLKSVDVRYVRTTRAKTMIPMMTVGWPSGSINGNEESICTIMSNDTHEN